MKNSTIITIFGLSGSGKTTLSERLEQDLKLKPIHCIGHVKRYFEELYGLDWGCLDTPEGKALKPEGMKVTMGELMVNYYHFWLDNDPCFSTRGLKKILETEIDYGRNFTLNAIRNLAEVKLLNDLSDSHPGLKIVKIWISGDREEKLSTDLLQEDLYEILKASEGWEFVNEYTSECLIPVVKQIEETIYGTSST